MFINNMKLRKLFTLTKSIRYFFESREFIDVITPPIVENPGMETHIHPFSVSSKRSGKHQGYLHTSPEFMMKKILADTDEGFNDIFTLTFSFRDEPKSPEHRKQFLMLEWYRKNQSYLKIIEDTQDLLVHSCKAFGKVAPELKITTVNQLFLKYLGFEVLDYLEFNSLSTYIKNNFPDIPLESGLSHWSWDDLFFILFLNKIEPELKNLGWVIIKDYPAPLAALSTISSSDKRVCERFELYIDGIEIANCFNELTDLSELRERFEKQNHEKRKLYNYELPEPLDFYNTMLSYPQSAGIALGVERLLMMIEKVDDPFIDS